MESFIPEQKPKFGKIDAYADFKSNYVTSRHIEVWLPEHYRNDGSFEVFYIHDGQMLFDPKTTWNGSAWLVDQVSQKWMNDGKVRDFIVIGIWNGGATRHIDYFPQKPYNLLNRDQKNKITKMLIEAGKITSDFNPISDDYLKFLTQELKPFIDKKYNIKTDRASTYVGGASMGGLISWYAQMEYPDVFGGAACMSTHWPGTFQLEDNDFPYATRLYLKHKIQDLTNQKIYFDYGNDNLDRLYPPLQSEINIIMTEYPPSLWRALLFDGHDHSEASWHSRFHYPLEFLFGKNN